MHKQSHPWRITFAELLILIFAFGVVAVKSYRVVNDFSRISLQGELNLNSVAQIQAALAMNPGVFNTLQFEDSPGAGAAATIILDKIEVLINRHQLRTEAIGRCASACAAAFLLGSTRSLLPTNDHTPTFLMIHAIRNHRTREVNYGKTEVVNKKIASKSLGKFPLSLLNRIFDDKKGTGDGEIYIYREPQRTPKGKHQVFVCDGAPHRLISECDPVPGVTPESLGIQVRP
ncbi:hypothetical protein [Undibacterium flavidum]|uniref:Prepilin-type N-terminal cleavage/methylation domain-containing protein n=1 Tax=Undibacterium flavidum TaxID=2762297 RepID=A0ABR6YF98_9BURK|nr:hypothetical protein [Undibacterium flavidum]MBC3875256.1 hypothetical protein [Undibacterium flavidum]